MEGRHAVSDQRGDQEDPLTERADGMTLSIYETGLGAETCIRRQAREDATPSRLQPADVSIGHEAVYCHIDVRPTLAIHFHEAASRHDNAQSGKSPFSAVRVELLNGMLSGLMYGRQMELVQN